MELTWNLTHLYKNDDDWEKDATLLSTIIDKLEGLIGNALDSSHTFREYLKLKLEADVIIERVYCYPKRHIDLDSMDEHYKELFNKALKIYGRIQVLEKKFETAIIENDQLVAHYLEHEDLKKYKRYISLYLRKREHLVTEVDFENYPLYTKRVQDLRNDYNRLIANTNFGKVTLDNTEHELNPANYNSLIDQDSQEDRKKVFDTFMDGYISIAGPLTENYLSKLNNDITLSKLEKYDSLLSKVLYETELSPSVLDSLISKINENLGVLHRSVQIKKELSGLSEFHIYDSGVHLVDTPKRDITIEEAISITKQALAPLGPEYLSLIDKMFNEGWIDVYPKKNKRIVPSTGISFGGVPYVLINFDGSFYSLKTLCHEIGHAANVYFSKNSNEFQDFEFTMLATEIASKVNELLLFDYLINSASDSTEKAHILNFVISTLTNSMYGYIMLTEFEHTVIKRLQNGEELNVQDLSQLYFDISKKYNGEAVTYDDNVRYGWLKTPHFFVQDSYYLYQYSLGLAIACDIVSRIKKGEIGLIENYQKFLSLGRSLPVSEALKIVGIDIENPRYIDEAATFLADKIRDMEEIIKNDKKLCLRKMEKDS